MNLHEKANGKSECIRSGAIIVTSHEPYAAYGVIHVLDAEGELTAKTRSPANYRRR